MKSFLMAWETTVDDVEAVLRELNEDVACAPEIFDCLDGELPRAEVNRRARRLNKEREEIIVQLGYTPTDEEIWHADD